jgi:hypothetical protein
VAGLLPVEALDAIELYALVGKADRCRKRLV